MIKYKLHTEQSESTPNNRSIKRMQYRITILNDQKIEILNEIKEVIKSIPGIGLFTVAIILDETKGFEMIRNKNN